MSLKQELMTVVATSVAKCFKLQIAPAVSIDC